MSQSNKGLALTGSGRIVIAEVDPILGIVIKEDLCDATAENIDEIIRVLNDIKEHSRPLGTTLH